MSSSPIVNRIRVIPRETDFLENNVGSRGEIYFDNDNDTLRLYNKETKGGFLLVNEKKLTDALDGLSTGNSISTIFDLTDVDSNSIILDAANGQGKILSWDQTANAFVPTDLPQQQQASAQAIVSDNAPSNPSQGDLWWNSIEGVLKIYYDDGTSQQWIDATPRGGGFSGSYTDIPLYNSFSGSYNDLTDKPTLFSGSYNDLTDIPLSNSFSGSYNDLTDKPTLFSGSYNDLTNKPTLFSGSWNDLTNKPTLFSGSYNDLTNKPTLFSGSWDDLTNKPNFATVATSGNFADLSNTPNVTGKAIAMSILFG